MRALAPVFVVRSFHETSHELSSLVYLAPFRIFTATPHRTMVLRRLALGFGIALIGS
jgi:hypothetical protein